MPNLSFLQGHIQDIDQISWLSREFFQESLMPVSGKEIAGKIDALFSRAAIIEDLNEPDIEYWIIQLESKGIGYMRITQNKPDRGCACMDRLIMLQAYWTKERLESLISFAEYRAGKLNMKQLYLVGWQVLHPAAKAFEKLGFTATDISLADNLDTLGLKQQKFVKSTLQPQAPL